MLIAWLRDVVRACVKSQMEEGLMAQLGLRVSMGDFVRRLFADPLQGSVSGSAGASSSSSSNETPFWYHPWQGNPSTLEGVVDFYSWAAVLFCELACSHMLPIFVSVSSHDDLIVGVSLPADLF